MKFHHLYMTRQGSSLLRSGVFCNDWSTKVHKKHATVHDCFRQTNNVIGMMPWNRRKRNLTWPIARSTCIRTRVIFFGLLDLHVIFRQALLATFEWRDVKQDTVLHQHQEILNLKSSLCHETFPGGTSFRRSQMPLFIKSWWSPILPQTAGL